MIRPVERLPAGVVDLGDPTSWPDQLRELVDDFCKHVRLWPSVKRGFPSSDLATLDYDWTVQAERRFREAVAPLRVLAYHASRLFDCEVAGLRESGLEPLSWDLIDRKLEAARQEPGSSLSNGDVELLRKSGPLCWQGGGVRLGLLWLVAPYRIFRHDRDGFARLLGDWGGEAIGWTADDTAKEIVKRLTKLSKPSIVEVAIDSAHVCSWRYLWPTALGGVLGLQSPWTEWNVTFPVGGEHVLDVIQPGSDRWPYRNRGSRARDGKAG